MSWRAPAGRRPRRAGRRARPRRRARRRHRRPDAVDLLPEPAGRPHARSTRPRGLSAGAGRTGPRPSPPRCARRPCSRWRSGSPSPASSGSPRSAAGWSAPSPRPLGGGWVWQVLLGVLALIVDRPAGHAAAGGLRRGGPAPLRPVHPQLGAVAARRRRRPPAIDAGLTALRPAGARLARPPRAADVVGLGRRSGRPRSSSSGPSSSRWSSSRRSTGSSRCRPGRCAPTCSRWPSENGTPVQDVLVVRRLPPDDGAERLRVRLRLDPADRRLRHGARPAARRPDRVDRRARARPRRRRRRPDRHADRARSARRRAWPLLGWLLSLGRRCCRRAGADSAGRPAGRAARSSSCIAVGTLVVHAGAEPGLPAHRGPRRRARPRPDPRPGRVHRPCSASWPSPTSPTPTRPPPGSGSSARTRRRPQRIALAPGLGTAGPRR